ncbi:calcium/sodium antiporter [Marinomonas sp. 15G1-11]|uniref:Calcium/sodium antiporter n=1 Tax=Marinomonas phaeophyticola TaxID=3004091 RepID=A0ABT4JXD0_9GAMM|nr:calcium/sodium antiporter [Marinomonas sp. 15G1-11]MCZ2723037.1 calcium/sodium antiporter [Marinomonas sp. 15G1-11]
MLLFIAALISGLIILVISSDKFIEHSALVAEKLNISPIIIGLTLVALGTSAPEMVVSAIASLDDAPEIAIGNVLGSNIANVALVFGSTLFFSAISIKKGLATKEVPLLMFITVFVGALLYDLHLSFFDGVLLIIAFIVVLTLLLRGSKNLEGELTEELPDAESTTLGRSLIIAIIGLLALIGSSKLLVWGAIGIAQIFGVSELIIGLTIVAIGTSLPELAASITSVKKGLHDIAIGNILGSNLFNLATVLPLPALLAPGAISSSVLHRDYLWVLGTTTMFCLLIIIFNTKKRSAIPKWVGLPLISGYFVYLFTLYQSSIS